MIVVYEAGIVLNGPVVLYLVKQAVVRIHLLLYNQTAMEV